MALTGGVLAATLLGGAFPAGAAGAPASGSATATDVTGDGAFPGIWPWWTGDVNAFWAGGSAQVGPVSQPYQDGQTYNTIAAKLQAPRPGCDDGTATVTVRSTVHLLGPTAGVGQNGFAKLGTDFDTAPGTNTTAGMPVGGTQTLETTVEVPAADLAAGNVKYWMILETYHGGSKAWEISDFSATYTYDTSTCADLGVTKSTEPSVDQVQQGERISYAVVVTNHGPGQRERDRSGHGQQHLGRHRDGERPDDRRGRRAGTGRVRGVAAPPSAGGLTSRTPDRRAAAAPRPPVPGIATCSRGSPGLQGGVATAKGRIEMYAGGIGPHTGGTAGGMGALAATGSPVLGLLVGLGAVLLFAGMTLVRKNVVARNLAALGGTAPRPFGGAV
ncbi:hypothetical protein [Amycolatopsis thermoflava]